MFEPLDRFPGRSLFGPTIADKLLANAQSVKLELLRFLDDADRPAVAAQFELVGCINLVGDSETSEMLMGIVQALRAPRQEGGAA